MQHFYNKLHTAKDGQTTYHRFLAQLTKASRAQITALPNSLGWGDWGP